MAPAHISVHTDNRQETNSLETARGQANLQLIRSADILFFTGGDQSKHVRAWLNDDGSDSPLLAVVRERAFSDEIIVSGSSAGSMVYADETYGYGSPYGVLYFANSVGLAPKTISDADVNGTNLADVRNGTNCTQYDENAGRMPGFRWTSIIFDTHFHVWGRIGRIAPFLVDLERPIAVGLD
jgi:cyanophycinase